MVMNKRNKLPPLKLLNMLFRVDARRGLLIRKVTRAPNALKGDVVGTVDGKGYLHTNLLGVFYRVHRIIFFMHYGYEPDGIDHRDQDRLNNRPKNLRPANDKQNAGNVRHHRHNTSGFRGVSKNTGSGFWHAQIKINGKQTYLGRSRSKHKAAELYRRAAKKHFGSHYGAHI